MAINNEDIINNIIKKENGVNPFLTVMNFKISFKTWIKFARKEVREERKKNKKLYGEDEYYDNYTSTILDDNKKPYSVDIEVEEIFYVTSEEESQADPQFYSQGTQGMKGKSFGMGSMSNSQLGSNMDLGGHKSASKEKKYKDPLALFEKKITQKFKKMQGTSLAKSNMSALQAGIEKEMKKKLSKSLGGSKPRMKR
jgi:hypothetical protein